MRVLRLEVPAEGEGTLRLEVTELFGAEVTACRVDCGAGSTCVLALGSDRRLVAPRLSGRGINGGETRSRSCANAAASLSPSAEYELVLGRWE